MENISPATPLAKVIAMNAGKELFTGTYGFNSGVSKELFTGTYEFNSGGTDITNDELFTGTYEFSSDGIGRHADGG
jgi:hypothetical protein